MLSHYILSLLIWFPIAGGLFTLATGNDKHTEANRWVALMFAIITLLLCVPLYLDFDSSQWQMQFVENVSWIPALHIRYALGVDGISMLFILLTCFTNLIVILAAWRAVTKNVAQYMSVFLISTGIMNGSFAATDSILFYFFWEASLIPMYLGIGIWGGKLRSYAAIKFFLYTFLGSIFLLVAFLYMGNKAGSFSIAGFSQLSMPPAVEDLIFLAFFAAFAVKIPMWPVHTWLPDAHTEAPAGGSVVMAALMLKMGAYGFIRFSLPIVADVHANYEWFLIVLSLIAVVYVGFACVVQKDMKRLIAYSSISHMGLVTLGLFMMFMIVGKTGDQADGVLSVQGAMFQMIAHAFSSGALFVGVSYLYIRFGSRMIHDYQGIAKVMPIFAAFFMLFAMANVGLPGTSGFVGEFLIILAAFKANVWIALIAATTLILAPAYTLWMYKRVLFGATTNPLLEKGPDINGSEVVVFILLAIPIVIFGLYPEWILNISQATVAHMVQVVMHKIPAGVY
jgi:NADH-quinone oxidoreductase subunit M